MLLKKKGRNESYFVTCEYKNDMFTILKGSKISNLRNDERITKVARINRENDKLVDENRILKKNISFKSATTAAQFVVGQSVNGKKFWKDSSGKRFL